MASKTENDVVKTVTIPTAHGPRDVAAVTSTTINGRLYYNTHRYNSIGQRIWGGCQFPAASVDMCKYYGVPVVPHE